VTATEEPRPEPVAPHGRPDGDGQVSVVEEAGVLVSEDAEGVEGPGLGASIDPPGMCQLIFSQLEMDLPNPNPVVMLQERDVPHRQLRIPIGMAEGVAIAYAWRRIPTPKPLTHDLFVRVLEAFGLGLEVVRITEVEGGSFSGEIVVNGRQGQRIFACRPSDAIALALRQRMKVPIVATDEVMGRAGTYPEG
jgi:hypothetical protein